MRIHVAKWGNSAAVRLPKAVVDELGLQPGREIELTVGEGEVRLRAVEPVRGRLLLEQIIAEADRIGWQNQPPLLDWGPDVGSEIIDDDHGAPVIRAASGQKRVAK